MNRKLLLGLLLILLLIPCPAIADGCETCGDNPVFAEDAVAVAVDDWRHTKTCIHGVAFTFGHSYSLSPDTNRYKSDNNYHWEECTKCGASTHKQEHFAYCDNLTICRACGVSYSGDSIDHKYNYNSYEHDSDQHWRACTNCGASSDKLAHYSSCDKPTVYAACGADYSGDNIQHHYGDAYGHDNDQHWRICTICGVSSDKWLHYASCDNPTICRNCGADYSGNNIGHKYNNSYEHDADHHWRICSRCGASSDKRAHYASLR